MGRFFLKLSFFLLVLGIPYLYFQYPMMAKNDAFYWKSTYPANTLIIGGSRAFKGISPAVLQEDLLLEGRVLNLAFTGVLSPYGKPYFNLIKRKIDRSGALPYCFILSVNPGNVMDFTAANVPRESTFDFYHLWMVNTQPNLEYVFRHPRTGQALLTAMVIEKSRTRPGRAIYQDGYAATFFPPGFTPPDRTNRKNLLKFDLRYSPEREAYLVKTVNYLSQLGPVYLVRLPVSSQMLAEEDKVYPEFNTMVEAVANQYPNTFFFDFTADVESAGYVFSDGHHHLEGKSAIRITHEIAERIKSAK